MSMELESMWGAMKDVHYKRTIDKLEQSIRSAGNLEAALSLSLDLVVSAVHAVTGTFWFFDKFFDGRIRPKAVFGGGNLGGISLLPGEGIAGQVVESGKSQIIADCQKDPRWAGRVDAKTGFKTESMLCVPLAMQEMVFGCIQIINKNDGLMFDDKDLSFAEQLSQATAGLFKSQGLLDDYLRAEANAGTVARPAVSFAEVFSAPDDRELEYRLRQVDEFSALKVTQQDAVLKLAREMRKYFAAGSRRAGRFFR